MFGTVVWRRSKVTWAETSAAMMWERSRFLHTRSKDKTKAHSCLLVFWRVVWRKKVHCETNESTNAAFEGSPELRHNHCYHISMLMLVLSIEKGHFPAQVICRVVETVDVIKKKRHLTSFTWAEIFKLVMWSLCHKSEDAKIPLTSGLPVYNVVDWSSSQMKLLTAYSASWGFQHAYSRCFPQSFSDWTDAVWPFITNSSIKRGNFSWHCWIYSTELFSG